MTNLVTTTQSVVLTGGFASLSENKSDVQIGTPGAGLNITALRTKARAQIVNNVPSATVESTYASITLAGLPISAGNLALLRGPGLTV
ncbi:MAG: hypothetical protein ACR2LO_11025, partial [Ilumatobacteraceae bacterium]